MSPYFHHWLISQSYPQLTQIKLLSMRLYQTIHQILIVKLIVYPFLFMKIQQLSLLLIYDRQLSLLLIYDSFSGSTSIKYNVSEYYGGGSVPSWISVNSSTGILISGRLSMTLYPFRMPITTWYYDSVASNI